VTPIQVDETTIHAVFAQPHTPTANEHREDDTESEPEILDAASQTQDTVTDNAHETDDTDSDTQEDPAPDWTVTPTASTFLRFYSDEPGYLQTNPASEVSTSENVYKQIQHLLLSTVCLLLGGHFARQVHGTGLASQGFLVRCNTGSRVVGK
jgi:hypothetical protein